MKIRVRNFQSIADAAIEAIGFTVITGRSNIGKSALLRAVRGAIFGLPGDYYIADDATWTGVRIQDENLDIQWRKVATGKTTTKKQTTLTVNGMVHSKIGRDHQVLTRPLGFQEIETTNVRRCPQLALQHDNIFLLTEAETTAAEIFKMLGRVDIVTDAQKAAKRDLGREKSVLLVRRGDQEKTQERFDSLDYVKELRVKFGVAKGQVDFNDTIREENEGLQTALKRYLVLIPTKLPIVPILRIPEELDQRKKLVRLMELEPRVIQKNIEIKRPKEIDYRNTVIALIRSEADLAILRGDLGDVQESIKGIVKKKVELEEALVICPLCKRHFGHD